MVRKGVGRIGSFARVDFFSCDLNAGHSGLSISLLLLDRREISQRHHTHDAHIFVHNGQILKVMLAHDFSCLIRRLMFEAIINFFYHDSANQCRLGIMAKAAALPLRVIALHGPNQTMIRFNRQSVGLERSHPFAGFLDGTSGLQRFRLVASNLRDEPGSLFGRF